MAQKLEHNDKVVSVTPADIPLFEEDVEIIQKLNDEPNDVEGLSAQELKERFDQAGVELKTYINETLIPTVVSDALTEQARAQAEGERVQNEQERVANENKRIANEEARSVFEEYETATTYHVGNKVAYKGSSYVCIKECFNVTPDDTAHWLLIARKGVSPTVYTEEVEGGTDIVIAYGENGESVHLFIPSGGGGGGSGDMRAAVYDPQGKKTDIFAYADKARTPLAHASSHATGGTDAIAPADIGAATVWDFNLNVPRTGWTENSAGGWSCSIGASGIKSTDIPIVDVSLATDIDANLESLDSWARVSRVAVNRANAIAFYCHESKPLWDFNVKVKVVR